ncbi:MAG: hypothetical protein ACRDYC_04385, partial [Acidimicrobiales bacterium]
MRIPPRRPGAGAYELEVDPEPLFIELLLPQAAVTGHRVGRPGSPTPAAGMVSVTVPLAVLTCA